MELHRSRKALIGAGVLGAGGIAVLVFLGERVSVFRWIVALVGIPLCVAVVFRELRPFRFQIGEQGLDLRVYGINRPVAWDEIDAIVLEQPSRVPGANALPSLRLVLVPVAGSDLNHRLVLTSPVDNRPARRLLECDDVDEPADDIARALARFGGARFTDVRERRSTPAP